MFPYTNDPQQTRLQTATSMANAILALNHVEQELKKPLTVNRSQLLDVKNELEASINAIKNPVFA